MRNTITLTVDGYAARDAEIKYTPQGTAVTEVTVPYTPRRLNKQTQQWEDSGETIWVGCAFWDKDAEPAQQAIKKGTPVTVTGTPKVRVYTGRDGQAHAALDLTVRSWGVQPPRQPQGQPGTQPAAPAAAAADPWNTGRAAAAEPPF